MTEKEISEAIFRLRTEIESTPVDDPARREQLESLLNDLEDGLETPEGGHRSDLLDDLKEAVASFESEHPSVSGILNEIMVMLGNMGI